MSASPDFEIGANALLPVINRTLRDANGPVDLTGASAVTFIMAKRGVNKVDAAGSFTSAIDGEVRYTWTGTDTNTPGWYDAWFEVTINSKKLRFGGPGGRPLIVRVRDDYR